MSSHRQYTRQVHPSSDFYRAHAEAYGPHAHLLQHTEKGQQAKVDVYRDSVV